MADTTAVAIYKLGLESQDYVRGAQAAIGASNQLVAAQERVAVSEEKVGAASQLAANALQKRIERNDAAARAQRVYADAVAFAAKAEEQQVGNAQQRAQYLAQEAEKLKRTTDALAAKAKAERDAAQAAKDAESAAKNLARIESEHALALKNTAAALGQDQAALIASANAGNRHAAATLDMMNKIVGLNKSLQEGKLNLAGHAAEIDRVQQAYRGNVTAIATQEAAMRKSSTVTGLARHELINLSRQFQDIGVSLAGGQSPFRILIEQGSQILDVFASSKAVFGDVFRSMIGWAGNFLTSFKGVVGVVGTLAAAGGALAIAFLDSQGRIERSLIGIGERAGLTVKQVNEIAEAAAKTGRLSPSGAAAAAQEFIKTGKMYSETVAAATNITDKFALAMGVSAADAAKQLAEILSDTDKGAETLNDSFGFLDGNTKELIRSLNAQNKQQEAMLVLLNAVEPAIRKAAEASSIWARMWLGLTDSLRTFIDTTGREIVGLINVWNNVTNAVKQTITEMETAFKRGREFQLQREEGRGRQGSPGRVAAQELREPSAAAAPVRATTGALQPAIDELALYKKAMDDAIASRDRLFGREAEAAVKSLIPQIQQLQNLEKVLEDVKRAQESGSIRGGMAEGMVANLQAAANIGEVLKRGLEEAQAAAARAAAELLKLAGGGRQAAASVTVIRDAAQEGAVAVIRMGAAGRGISVEFQKISGAADAAGVSIIRMGDAYKGMSLETVKILSNLNGQIAVANQVTGQAKIQAQEEARITQLKLEGKSATEAVAIATKETALAQAQLTAQHKQNVEALQDQLAIAKARTEEERSSAQFEADRNARIREGATAMQAEEEAALKQEIAAANATDQRAEAAEQVAAAEKRAAQEAQKAAAAAVAAALAWGKAAVEAGDTAANAAQLNAIIAATSRGATQKAPGPVFGMMVYGKFISPVEADKGYFASAMQTIADNDTKQASRIQAMHDELFARDAKAAEDNKNAAAQQVAAAKAQMDAAKQQIEVAKQAREEQISALDEAVKDIVATKLLAGQSAQAVNMLIEGGAIQFGTASTRFQTQLDLYKRAGASNAQIAADIRSGIIGEGAKPSELLAALDGLTDAVTSNTEAQIGLSEFYTQQGNRLLGYRGFNVQRGGFGATAGTATGGTGAIGGGMTGGMGGVVNPPGQVAAEFQGGGTGALYPEGTVIVHLIGNEYVTYKLTNGQWIEISRRPRTTAVGGWQGMAEGGIMSSAGRIPLRSYQDGGIAYGPHMAVFGEGAAPEAFVPLKGGAIPVKLTGNNDNKPTTVVNINAPLVNFMAEPSRDDVKESAFQAAQMLRRIAVG